MARPVRGATLQKVPQFALHGLQCHAAGRVVAAECLDHVVGEEALHVVEHPGRALVQQQHLLWWEECGLPIATERWKIIFFLLTLTKFGVRFKKLEVPSKDE